MGTIIYGNTTGPGPSYFRTVYEYAWSDEGDHCTLVYNVWFEVISGDEWGSNIYCSWNGKTVSTHGQGQYNVSLYNIVGNIPYGGRHDVNLYCQYTGGSGRLYNSRVQTTLYAPQKTRFTVSFDANGGHGAPGQITVDNGATVIIPNSIPYKDGYDFNGWNEDRNATVGVFSPNGAIVVTRNYYLYAIWRIKNYTLTYNGNSDGAINVPGSQTIYHGSVYHISSQVPIRNNYRFLGWSENPNGPAQYQPGQMMNKNQSYTLYAIWQIIIYTMTYNANGGQNAPATQTKESGEYKQMSNQIPTRTGYRFLGWSEQDPNGPVTHQPGSIFRGNYDVTFYAKWEILKYTVSYDANGGSGAPGNQTKTHGISLTLSTTAPTRLFYRFKGWSTTRNGTVSYQPGGSYQNNADVTLYAVWELAANCFVKVNGVYKPGMMYVKRNGSYQKGSVFVKNENGVYKPTKV